MILQYFKKKENKEQIIPIGQYKKILTETNLFLNEIIFLGVDLFKENLIIGFIIKNDLIKDGVLFSKSSSVPLSKISQESLDNVLKKFGIKI